MKRTAFLSFLALVASLNAQVTKNTPGWTEFDVPGLDAPANTPVDVSYLNTEPAGTYGFIRVKDGKFMDDRGTPLRLFGTNVTGNACIPETRDDGRRLAKRLRQYGFNCLRLHFMDLEWHKGGVWKNNATSEFNEDNLKKLDAFIVDCNREGIFINVNLHVARKYPSKVSIKNFKMGKIVDRWYDPLIAMQEDYAQAIMGRINTVSGVRYADNPGIMCVEINNENTMIKDIRKDIMESDPAIREAFLRKWNSWLKAKYKTDHALRTVWDSQVVPLGEPILTGAQGWYGELSDGAQATLDRTADDGCRWVATKRGENPWNMQLQLKKFKLKPGLYTVTFEARSQRKSVVEHCVMLDAHPWSRLGLFKEIALTPEWKTYAITGAIKAAVNDSYHRVNFSLNNTLGEMEVRNYRIQPGGGTKLSATQTLDTHIDMPGKDSSSLCMKDFLEFLMDTEMNTTRRLANYLRNTLKCRMPVTDTQVNYGGIGGLKREATISDYIDIHTYQAHPWKRVLDGREVRFIRNHAAVAEPAGGAVPRISFWRVKGKPFSVSEYNVPAPNDHNADMFAMYSVWASIQDWDAFFSYTYRDFGTDYDNTQIRGFFQFIGRAGMLVHIPFASLLYRQRLMPTPKAETILEIPVREIPSYLFSGNDVNSLAHRCGGEIIAAASQKISVTLNPHADAPRFIQGDGKAKRDASGAIVSEEGAFKLANQDPKGAWASLNLPSARLLTGHLGGREFAVGDITVKVAARPWPHQGLPAYSCLSLIALDGKPLTESARMLLASSARTENCNFNWNKDRSYLIPKKNHYGCWGEKPNMSELVPATLVFPQEETLKLTVLDPQGRPTVSRLVPAKQVELKATDKTLWYLIERVKK